jgi:hypothetical protein
MIIVIGKEDRAKMLDAQAYVHQYGKLMLQEQWTSRDSAKIIDADCQKIANRILKALGKKFRHE